MHTVSSRKVANAQLTGTTCSQTIKPPAELPGWGSRTACVATFLVQGCAEENTSPVERHRAAADDRTVATVRQRMFVPANFQSCPRGPMPTTILVAIRRVSRLLLARWQVDRGHGSTNAEKLSK